MFERFTDRSQRVVVLAQEEARTLNHEYVGTEHILLGLIREGGGVAAQALESLGISEEAARRRVEEIVGRGQADPARRDLPFTPRGKKVLQLSLREAMALGHGYVGTEHILLGLIREDEGVATRVLDGLGVDPNRIRQQVIRLVSARQVRGKPGTGRAGGWGKRKQLAELRHQLAVVSWRLSVLEQRVGTTPDLAQLDREITQEWAALPSLSDEVERLRDVLRRHGIDPQDGAA
jgi:ATP-dependent Clp protease ATP-binding subunit ClpC